MKAQIDPEARRDTPLAEKLRQQIETHGPISVEEYVRACLYDPQHGYYVSKPAIGYAADFITAPEISQVFGELLGIWTVLTWQQMGSSSQINLIELGPGRGTMIADALRSIAKAPALARAIEVHLVDSNAVLRETQRGKLSNVEFKFNQHGSMDDLVGALSSNNAPSIVLANEFIDALGIRQLVALDGDWRERTVELNDDRQLQFSSGELVRPVEPHSCSSGDILEESPAIEQMVRPFLVALGRQAPLAALFIDYGYTEPAIGDTLQALRNHAYEDVLTSPGEADLTAHVDFASFAACLSSTGLTIDGPVPQAEFLGRLGIVERTSQLMAQNPTEAASIEAGSIRLLAPNGMGTRFHAVAARNWAGPSLTGFASPS